MFLSAYLNGLALGAGLIIAIGAQNAHVLRMGLKREHVALTVGVCIVIDVALICLGVGGMGALVHSSALLMGLARWGGAAFLLVYGVRSWRAVFGSAALLADAARAPISARAALLTVLALSLLNPHVYLDAVVLLGAIGGNFSAAQRPSFAFGAITASIIWFCALGFGARVLSGLFSRPVAWKWLDGMTGTTMLALSATLALGA